MNYQLLFYIVMLVRKKELLILMVHLKTLSTPLFKKCLNKLVPVLLELISNQDKLDSKLLCLISWLDLESNSNLLLVITISETMTVKTYPNLILSNLKKPVKLDVWMMLSIQIKSYTLKVMILTTLLLLNTYPLSEIVKELLMNIPVKFSWMELTLFHHIMYVKIVY